MASLSAPHLPVTDLTGFLAGPPNAVAGNAFNLILEALYMPTPQVPIGSGFGAASTAAEVIAGRDLTGKTIVVTGGYSGIGVETVRAFRSAGAKVVVPARDSAKAQANLADMP